MTSVVLLVSGHGISQSSLLLRYPALSPDGRQIAFSYQGDIWRVPVEGGDAARLTIHEAYESEPQWSPDGSMLAFRSNRHGNGDLFTLSLEKGEINRVTYHSATDAGPRWLQKNELLFTTRRSYVHVEREREFHRVQLNGGTPWRMLDALGDMPAASPDGRFIAFTRGSCRIAREAYTGPANHDLWIYDREQDRYLQLTDHPAQEIFPDWGDARTLYYLSAASGKYNIYKISLNDDGRAASAAVPLTSYDDMGIRFFDVSADGSTLVFERGMGIHTMPAEVGASAVEVTVSLVEDQHFYAEEFEEYSSDAIEYALSPNEEYMAFTIRGELFLKENDKDKSRVVRLTDHAYRDGQPAWLNDSTILFVSDRDGDEDIYLIRSADPTQTNLFKTFKRELKVVLQTEEDESAIYLSPDRGQLAYRQGRGKLLIADIDSLGQLSKTTTLLDGWATPGGVTWSPDSRWLAYALEDLDFNEEIYIHPADNSQAGINVSLHPRSDFAPVWSPDGMKLGFQSIRNNGDSDLWFVWLRKQDWEKSRSDWEEEEEQTETSDSLEVTIDFEDIHERLVQVTRLPGNEDDLQISRDGNYFYFTTNSGGRTGGGGDPDLMQIKWDGTEMKVLQSDLRLYGLTLDDKGDYLYLLKRGGSLARLKIDGGKMENLPFRARMTIDYPQERQQIFNDAWRALEAGFYDPEFHGRDWQELRSIYEPMAMAASTTQDFRDIFNEMLGQIDASHMGLYGSDREEVQDDRTGLLGIEGKPMEGGFEVTRVIARTPASKDQSRLMTGDLITHVNGTPVPAAGNFWSLLNHLADEEILLRLEREGDVQEVIIRPTRSIGDALYEEWVDQRKALTEKYSEGRLGYIHIEGMNWPSFERFERELAASGQGKEGMVIDVRFNGGGWTTDMLMAVLNVRQHAYTIPRGAASTLAEHERFQQHYPYGERLPLSAWTKPSIAMCNQNSYSNAEIFSHAFKTLDLGTLVGTPTFGAVISTGAHRLIDGSLVRMPFRAWYVKATGENMEHGPAVPDVILENAPDSKADNEDPQLRKAVEVLLGEIGG